VENYLRGIKINWDTLENTKYYQKIPALKSIDKLDFHENITFLVGENGTGKSTLLEAMAVQYGFNPEGGSINFNFSSKNTHSQLCNHITLVKGTKRAKDGFFLRAESFYNVASEVDNLDDPSHIFLESYGGKSLHEQSHGESFLALIINRFRGNGLYLLDEPEAALSPQRQLSLLIRIKQLVDMNSQFIIATHSPILLGIDGAEIYSLDEGEIKPCMYEDTESYRITKMFIENRKLMLKNLLEE
jgi:predicted ATPase